jgi:hypothetical protein
MTTHIGPVSIDIITHDEYAQGDYLRPDEQPFFTSVTRKKIRPGRFKKKIEVDHLILMLTEERVIVVQYDLFRGYYLTRFPYSRIDDVALSGKTHVLIALYKLDVFTFKLGDDAPRIHDEIQSRRDRDAEESRRPPPLPE